MLLHFTRRLPENGAMFCPAAHRRLPAGIVLYSAFCFRARSFIPPRAQVVKARQGNLFVADITETTFAIV
jgi:predicted deacetylase